MADFRRSPLVLVRSRRVLASALGDPAVAKLPLVESLGDPESRLEWLERGAGGLRRLAVSGDLDDEWLAGGPFGMPCGIPGFSASSASTALRGPPDGDALARDVRRGKAIAECLQESHAVLLFRPTSAATAIGWRR